MAVIKSQIFGFPVNMDEADITYAKVQINGDLVDLVDALDTTGDSPQFTAINLGHASDTTITRTGAGDIAVEGNAVYRAGGTDVPVTDGGTGASTAAAGFRALAEGIGSTQGDIIYRNASQWVVLGAGVSGQVLKTNGAGFNPEWATLSGDMLAANNLSDVANASTARLNLGVAPGLPQGRLTLTTATPVLTSTVSAASTIYYAVYAGQHVPIYDGTRWKMHDIGGELSQATTDSTKSPAACTTNSNYDLFVWNDSGTYRCTRGPAWSSSTARGTGAGTTELERVNGVWVNKIAITNGPAAQRGTYVGTIRTNGTSTVDFTATMWGVWNAYNRVTVFGSKSDTTDSWTYATATWRQARGATDNLIAMVRGLDEDACDGAVITSASNSPGGAFVAVGIGIDSDTTNSAQASGTGTDSGTARTATCRYVGRPGLGYRELRWLEITQASGTTTFYGDGGLSYISSAITVTGAA